MVNAVPGVPFAFLFVGNELALVNAAGSSVATYEVNRDGTLTQDRAPVGDGQAAACWIVRVGNSEFVDNTGSNDVSQYRVGADGGGRFTSVDPDDSRRSAPRTRNGRSPRLPGGRSSQGT